MLPHLSASTTRRLHLVGMAAWLALLAPTLIWWRDSVLWVATMSLYANFVGHWSSWQAARSEESDGRPTHPTR